MQIKEHIKYLQKKEKKEKKRPGKINFRNDQAGIKSKKKKLEVQKNIERKRKKNYQKHQKCKL